MPVRTTTVTTTAKVSPLVTRGFGTNKFRIITQGFGTLPVIIQKIVRVIRGGRTKFRDMYGDAVDEFTIAARIALINGKQLVNPIINNKYIVKENENSVKITNVSIKKENKGSLADVFASLLKVKRGSDEHG